MTHDGLTGFAVDIGGTKTAAARIENGKVVQRNVVPTVSSADLTSHLDGIAHQLEALSFQSGNHLGVAVTGRVTRAGEWFAVNSGTLPAITGVPLGCALKDRFSDAWSCNDAAAAAFAEANYGSGQGCSNFVYLTVSTGVGGGLVAGGRLIESGRGLAGHLGFTSSRAATHRCGSGRMGTIESVAAGRAIARAAAEAGYPRADARDVFEAAQTGEEWANMIVEKSASAIAGLCADMAALLDPDCIAVGGSIGLASGYLQRVRRHLGQEPELFQVPLVTAQLGSDGPLLGALALAETGRH